MSGHTFVHVGDIHLQAGPRRQDVLDALEQIIEEGSELPTLAAWLLPGDLFHQRSSIDDRNALAPLVQAMALRAPVVICYGNHDAPGDLDVFERLQAHYPIFVKARPGTVTFNLEQGLSDQRVTIYVLPYPTKAGLVEAGVSPDAIVDTAADALEALFLRAAQQLEEARMRGDLTLMIGHVNVGGSIVSSGQPNIGREIELSARHLDLLGPIYKGLNHIHVAQEIAGAHYAGSICRLNWGEIESKSYTLVTLQDEPGLLPVVVRSPIDVPSMLHVNGCLSREGFRWEILGDTVVHDGTRAFDCEQADVRVRYTFPQSERNTLNHAIVRECFTNARRLEVEPVAETDRELRAPQVAAARTMAEKFAVYCDVSGLTETTGLQEKLARLERTDPTLLLNEVTRALAAEGAEKAEVAA